MLKRNWVAIASLADYRTRVAVSLATDAEIIACYQKGFPHLFVEGDDDGPLQVPLSVLMEAAAEYSRTDWGSDLSEIDRHFSLGLAFAKNPQLNLPVAFQWGDVYPVPPESVLKQLVGQKAQAGMTVMFEEKKYVVLNISFARDYPAIGSEITKAHLVYDISLVDAAFVALDQ